MENSLTIYHGSPQIIETPKLAKGKPNNDYGRGFYCTENIELAKEWACSSETDGFANRYHFDPTNLSVLDLSSGEYHILTWLSILLENRTFRINGDIAQRAHKYIFEHFMIEYKAFDVIKGYRADDSYFSFATAFLNNTISLAQLEKAMVLGNLGEQVVLRSQRAFDRITFVESTIAPRSIYVPKKMARDTDARAKLEQKKTRQSVEDEVFILDIIRERWENNDTRIQRILLG